MVMNYTNLSELNNKDINFRMGKKYFKLYEWFIRVRLYAEVQNGS